jgi:hypothetical protein
MPNKQVVCPECGTETSVAVPAGKSIEDTRSRVSRGDISSACNKGHKFGIVTR